MRPLALLALFVAFATASLRPAPLVERVRDHASIGERDATLSVARRPAATMSERALAPFVITDVTAWAPPRSRTLVDVAWFTGNTPETAIRIAHRARGPPVRAVTA